MKSEKTSNKGEGSERWGVNGLMLYVRDGLIEISYCGKDQRIVNCIKSLYIQFS